MCDPGNHAEVTPAEALPTSLRWKGEVLPLEPVDELSVLTVCDNTVDILRHGESWEPDPLILDDQALIAHVAGRGLVVLTGCGHAGIINICRYAQRLTGVGKLHAVIGGFHLAGPLFEPVIGDTVSALEQLAPEVIVPAHCTGWRATHAIARHLPGAFIQNSVGHHLPSHRRGRRIRSPQPGPWHAAGQAFRPGQAGEQRAPRPSGSAASEAIG